jgi:hypothetical protein
MNLSHFISGAQTLVVQVPADSKVFNESSEKIRLRKTKSLISWSTREELTYITES